MHELASTASDAPKRFQCRHIFTDGRRCRSACLRHEEFCYYHHNTRKPAQNPGARKSRRSSFDLPLPEDQSAIQTSIGQVLQRIATNDIDPRRAGLLLYGLQIASLNLPKPQQAKDSQPEAAVEEVITDAELGPLAPQAEMPKSREVRYAEVDRKSHEVWQLHKELDAKKKQFEIEQTKFLIERNNFEKALIRAHAARSSSPQPTVIPDVQGAAVADTGTAFQRVTSRREFKKRRSSHHSKRHSASPGRTKVQGEHELRKNTQAHEEHVISTGATDRFIVRCGVERSLYSSFV